MWSIPPDLAKSVSMAYCRSVQLAEIVTKEASAEEAVAEEARAET